MRWNYTPADPGAIERIRDSAGVDRILAELLWRAGCTTGDAAARFLDPALAALGDPFAIPNLERAVKRIADAIAHGESVVVLGDYDVDGVSSTALLVSLLRRLGLQPRFVVPRRSEDGYGLSQSAIDRALEEGKPDLFIALDCGTNSCAEIAYLTSNGTDVIVIDHHKCRAETPAGAILINPHVSAGDESQAACDFCTVGLVFKLAHGLLKHLRATEVPAAFEIRLRDSLDFVALGTVADLVPLRGENRILARHGLRLLQDSPRPGLRALMDVSGIRPGQEIWPVDVSYRLGPRINASGRLADAAVAVELLLSDSSSFASEVAGQLDAFNRERQEIERLITQEAERHVEEHFADSPGIVLYADTWHPGVVGIVAGRVSRKYNRPCVVLGDEGGRAKGSGRGVSGINLVDVLADCREHLESWGGHPMAVGIALDKDNLEAFREGFAEAVRRHSANGIAEANLEIATWLRPDEIDDSLMHHLDTMHPFGQGNPAPVFGIRNVVLRQRPEVFKEQHFRFSLPDGRGRRISGVAWKMADRPVPAGTPVDLAVEAKWNFYNDRKLLQLELHDWRPARS
jgi:single-stranded-DNA-specific exonuclease